MDFIAYVDPDEVNTEDGGQARYVELRPGPDDQEHGMFVRLHSWDEGLRYGHTELAALVGRRVRVRIEPVGGVCRHCGDHTDEKDPAPELCVMCVKAGRT